MGKKSPKPLAKVDELISFYERHKPEAGHRIETNFTPEELAKHLGHVTVGKVTQTEWPYRGRILVAAHHARPE